MTSSTDAAAVATRCGPFLDVFPLVYCDQNACWQTDRLFLTGWHSSYLLLRTLPKHNLYACVHAFLRPASLHMTASLPLSLSFFPPPPPVIRLFTGTTPTHSLKPGINTEPWQKQERFPPVRPIHGPSLDVRLEGGYVIMIMDSVSNRLLSFGAFGWICWMSDFHGSELALASFRTQFHNNCGPLSYRVLNGRHFITHTDFSRSLPALLREWFSCDGPFLLDSRWPLPACKPASR